MERTAVEFPQGSYYAMIWVLDADHTGMANALFHRSRSFVRQVGAPVTVLSYEYREDLAEVREALSARGSSIEGISIRNLWEDLCSWDDEALRRALDSVDGTSEEHFAPLTEGGPESTPLRVQELDDDGEPRQVDYYRPDGTLYLSHRKRVFGDRGVRVYLCDTSGRPIGHWNSMWPLYHLWLDSLPRDPVAYFLADSKAVANHVAEYRRPDAVTIYVVHGSHLANGEEAPHGALSAGRAYSFERLSQYDGVVFLTERQRHDAEAKFGPLDNAYVCPNARDVGTPIGSASRRRKPVGIVMGTMDSRKRVDHAVEAIAEARRGGARRVSLRIFGKGPKEKVARTAVRRNKLGRAISFMGYTWSPEREFAAASFSLLPSRKEGFGLVIVEAMAQGCVPIAYDINYGPSDIINDGVDGYLVPDGDVNAMGAAIARFCRMSRRKQSEVREAAMRRAQDFDDSAIVERWGEVIAACAAAQSDRVAAES